MVSSKKIQDQAAFFQKYEKCVNITIFRRIRLITTLFPQSRALNPNKIFFGYVKIDVRPAMSQFMAKLVNNAHL